MFYKCSFFFCFTDFRCVINVNCLFANWVPNNELKAAGSDYAYIGVWQCFDQAKQKTWISYKHEKNNRIKVAFNNRRKKGELKQKGRKNTKDMSENVKVIVRCRPMNGKERNMRCKVSNMTIIRISCFVSDTILRRGEKIAWIAKITMKITTTTNINVRR